MSVCVCLVLCVCVWVSVGAYVWLCVFGVFDVVVCVGVDGVYMAGVLQYCGQVCTLHS